MNSLWNPPKLALEIAPEPAPELAPEPPPELALLDQNLRSLYYDG